MSAKKLAMCGLFICFAAALSALESLLPPLVPIAGVRVGLGNIVTLLVLYLGGRWKAPDAFAVAVLRCFLAALITGSMMNAIYGVVGGILAASAMLITKNLLPKDDKEKYLPLTGVFGAILHITGQLMTAVVFYGGFSVLAYFPVLLASAIIGGAFTGLCTMLLLKKLPNKLLDEVRNV